MILIPENFNFLDFKKTNILAKQLKDEVIKISKQPTESDFITIRRCIRLQSDDNPFEYKEVSEALQILKRYLMIKGFTDVRFVETTDQYQEIIYFHLWFLIDKKRIESCQKNKQ